MPTVTAIRSPAVAGTFYPASPPALRRCVTDSLERVTVTSQIRSPKALIVPHAGFQYSGDVAASGYAQLRAVRHIVTRVILVGPCHRVPLNGLAVPAADGFATPLGTVPVDRDGVSELQTLPQVLTSDQPHLREHSLEVQLPFLQVLLDQFTVVPIAAGKANAAEVAEVLSRVWGGPETLIVISSDLSHFHDYQTARALDRKTAELIETLQYDRLTGQHACGYVGIRGLLLRATELVLRVEAIDLRNSGDTAGSPSEVIGYGAFVAGRTNA